MNTVLTLDDQARLNGIARQWAADYPDIYAQALTLAGRIVTQLTGSFIDPRSIYWHRFDSAVSSPRTFNGWEHYQRPIESMTLIQLVMHRFGASDQESLDYLETLSGFYTQGPEHDRFDEHNEVRLLVQDVAREFWAADFASAYKARIEHFWHNQASSFVVLSKVAFVASVAQAIKRGDLKPAQVQLLRSGMTGSLGAGISLATLSSPFASAPGYSVRRLDLAGVVARDILRVVDPQGRQVLYMPGDARALRGFEDTQALYDWLQACAQNPVEHRALLAHFSTDGLGEAPRALQRTMDQLRDDRDGSALGLVNQRDEAIVGDPFVDIRDVARREMTQQANTLLTSNSDLRKRIWIDDLAAFLRIAGELAPLAWPIALTVVGAGVTRMLLSIQVATETRDPQERQQAILNAVFSAIQAVMTAPLIFVGGAQVDEFEPIGLESDEPPIDPQGALQPLIDPVVPALDDGHSLNTLGMLERADSGPLYRVVPMPRGADPELPLRQGFAATHRFDYARKMLDGPVLRTFGSVRGALEFAQAAFDGPFALYEIDGNGLAAASLRENLQFNTAFTLSREQYPGDFVEQRLLAGRGLEDFANDGWRYDEVHLDHARLDSSRIRLVPPAELEHLATAQPPLHLGEPNSLLQGVKVRAPGGGQLVTQYSIEVNGYPQAVRYDPWSNAWRSLAGKAFRLDALSQRFKPVTLSQATPAEPAQMIQSLRQLGIKVRFPLQLRALSDELAQPVPRVIHQVWVGGPLPFANRIIGNARLIARGAQPFKTRLYLSIQDPVDLNTTMRNLARGQVDSLEVVMLEQTDFYRAFAQTPQHEQYLAARFGPGANHASAVDVLRYPLIDHEGGFYMDVDDAIAPAGLDESEFADEAFDVAPGQLLLNGLVCHRRLGLVMDFNTSNFASLANNPLLKAIGTESLRRFNADPSLYSARPYEHLNTGAEMDAYARRISATTGPGVFNEVIDEHLPDFRQFRALNRLAKGEVYLKPELLEEVKRQISRFGLQYCPLAGLIRIGATASWLHTR